MTHLELLNEINAWLDFNNNPSKEQLSEMRETLKEHLNSCAGENDVLHGVMPRISHFTDEVGCIYKPDDSNIDISIKVNEDGILKYAIKILGQHHHIQVVPIYVA